MHARRISSSARIISFSGIDGAGKTTQIAALCARLRGASLRVRVVAFWDEVAMLTRFRQAAAHALFKGDQGIGAPFAPINRRDKNVRSWLMTVVRLFLYTLDAVSARTAVKRALRSGADVVVFDRFIHDELANLNLRNPIMRAYVRLAANVASRPHISYLLDADPIQARARKPEYPIDFLYWSRQAYLVLGGLIGGLTVIEPMPTEETAQWVFGHIYKELSLRDSSAHPGVPACKRFIGGILPGGERSRPDAF